ncbi:ABC transporter permease [Cellulomonas sp. H30R-01]|uniref:Nickel ABC transporter permease n=1 Tax=Cellulomonas algicola TaxID=2071633 RepID=A0A401UZK8_9CELL|nr:MULTISPECIES: ABC transporter permease [Cellulomonas]QHT56247.1 ABC transporter permease [Cellulomonas sp. H30R-01]GCD20116.1 nickel ABC transporter permease [Cellulomonas algicola]
MTAVATVLVEEQATHDTRRASRTLGASGWVGAALLGLVVAVTLAAPLLVTDPLAQDFTAILQPPSAAHPFGTDELGRDLLARTVFGGRTALAVTAVATLVAAVLGLGLAVGGALFGGAVDAVASRLADVQLAVPTIVLAIVILSFVGNAFVPLVTVLVLGAWVLTFRVIRGHARAVVRQPFVEAARVAGAGRGAVAWRHLLPSVLPLFFVAVTLSASAVLLLESSLGFLGLGVQPPEADWGQMVAAGQARLATAPWLSLFPGVALIVTIVALQLLGDALAERTGTGRAGQGVAR